MQPKKREYLAAAIPPAAGRIHCWWTQVREEEFAVAPYQIGEGEALLLPVWGRTRASVSLGGDACGGPQPWAIPFQRPREEGNARSPLTPNLQLLSGRIWGRGALVPVSPSRRAPATTRRRPRMNESNAGRNPRQRKSELDVRE